LKQWQLLLVITACRLPQSVLGFLIPSAMLLLLLLLMMMMMLGCEGRR
jgi:hypothetical protein